MKRSRIGLLSVLSIFLSIFSVQAGFGQDAAALEVADPAICTGIEDRACVDPKEEFTMPVEKLYCFTRITGAAEDTEITHVWYFGDVERARISLAVRSSSYRTYSSKRIQAHETGKWHVDVLDDAGNVLKTISFSITQ